MSAHTLLGQRAVRAADVVLVVWTLVWIVLAVVVAREVWRLRDLTGSAVAASTAAERTADAVGALSDLPLIGRNLEAIEDNLRDAARATRQSAADARADVEELAVVLGATLAVGPTAPLLLVYLPVRRRWQRDRTALRSAVAGGRSPELDEYLAGRALATLPYDRLRAFDGEVGATRTRTLADAELRRLGLAPAARPPSE